MGKDGSEKENMDSGELKRIRKNGKRVTATFPMDEYGRLQYWAESKDMSINDYIRGAVEFWNRWHAGDVDLPTLEVQRLNQLVDGMAVLSQNVYNLEQMTASGFKSLTQLTRGENYLMEETYDE